MKKTRTGLLARKFLLLFVVVGGVTGCASLVVLSPDQSEGQKLVYQDGMPIIMSKKRHTVAVGLIADAEISKGRPSFLISFANMGNSAIDFAIDNVKIQSKGETLKVYSYEELRSEQEARHRMQAFGLALQGAGAAGMGDTLGEMQVQDRVGLMKQERAYLRQMPFLKRQTVFPGKAYAGFVVFDIPTLGTGEERAIIIEVVVPNESHSFTLRASRAQPSQQQ